MTLSHTANRRIIVALIISLALLFVFALPQTTSAAGLDYDEACMNCGFPCGGGCPSEAALDPGGDACHACVIGYMQGWACPEPTTYEIEDELGLISFGTVNPNGINIFIWIFYVAMGLTAALAVTMLVVGGIRYISAAGNAGQQGRARQQITNAVIGLVLAISSILILRTINPDLTEVTPPTFLTPAEQDAYAQYRAICQGYLGL